MSRPSAVDLPDLPDLLELGCGSSKLAGAWGLDALPLPGVDQVHDLNRLPWPLPSNHFGWVRAMDVLEHLDDFVGAVRECHRVLRPGGRLTVQMPFAGSAAHLTDPTHRRGATSRTMDYFVQGAMYNEKYHYTEPLFRLDGFRYVREIAVPPPLGWLVRALDDRLVPWAMRHNEAYEVYLSGLYPMHAVVFECTKLGG